MCSTRTPTSKKSGGNFMHHAKAIRKKERLKKRKTDGEFQIALKS